MSFWGKSWALLLVLTACDSAGDSVAAAGSAVGSPAVVPEHALLQGERGLRALAWVNQPELGKARSYGERHALLDELSASADAKRIDRRLNLALDLRQASDSPDPCVTYGTALGRIEQSADAYFSPHVQAAAPPSGCAQLGPQRDKVLAALRDGDQARPADLDVVVESPPEEPPDVASASTPEPTKLAAKKAAPRKRKRDTTVANPKPAQPPPVPKPVEPPAKKTRPSVASKIDEELKPFGM